jgi:hypothetical protein
MSEDIRQTDWPMSLFKKILGVERCHSASRKSQVKTPDKSAGGVKIDHASPFMVSRVSVLVGDLGCRADTPEKPEKVGLDHAVSAYEAG